MYQFVNFQPPKTIHSIQMCCSKKLCANRRVRAKPNIPICHTLVSVKNASFLNILNIPKCHTLVCVENASFSKYFNMSKPRLCWRCTHFVDGCVLFTTGLYCTLLTFYNAFYVYTFHTAFYTLDCTAFYSHFALHFINWIYTDSCILYWTSSEKTVLDGLLLVDHLWSFWKGRSLWIFCS